MSFTLRTEKKRMRAWPLVAVLGGCALAPSLASAATSAEMYDGKTYYLGRFEARIRYAPGDGVISSFFLWKNGSESSGAFWNEIDFEKVGADCHMQTNAIYGKSAGQHVQKNPMPGDICAEYHTYTIDWAPTYIAWYVDGKEIRRDTGDTATAFADNAKSGMAMHFNVWPGNASFGGTFSNTTLPVREYISWVQYSSYKDGAFHFEWREEFQGATMPAGWGGATWSSPFNLSVHSPKNVSLVDGIAVLSLTADDGVGNPGTPPADPGDGLDGGLGGSTGEMGGSSGTGGTPSGAAGTNGNDVQGSPACTFVNRSARASTTGALAGLMVIAGLFAYRRKRRP